jgi:ribosomal protein S27E
MKDARANFWKPYISRCDWTQVVFDWSTLSLIKSAYANRGDEAATIIERAFVFGAKSNHHAIVMGFPNAVVVEGHQTGARLYIVKRDLFEKYVSEELSLIQNLGENSAGNVVRARSFNDLKEILISAIKRHSNNPYIYAIPHQGGWQSKAEEILRNEFDLIPGKEVEDRYAIKHLRGWESKASDVLEEEFTVVPAREAEEAEPPLHSKGKSRGAKDVKAELLSAAKSEFWTVKCKKCQNENKFRMPIKANSANKCLKCGKHLF